MGLCQMLKIIPCANRHNMPKPPLSNYFQRLFVVVGKTGSASSGVVLKHFLAYKTMPNSPKLKS